MILVDTNIVSEAMKLHPNSAVRAWMDAQSFDLLYLCTPVLAELRYGIERLPRGQRKNLLAAGLDQVENELYRGRILSFDPIAAGHYGRLMMKREQQGRRLEQMDGLIAAIALAHGATVATRDARDFAGLGFEVINPFDPR
jgi:predicted nucleic acid-binding protein